MTHAPANTDEAPVIKRLPAFHILCDRCCTGILRPGRISAAFWRGEHLVIVRNIPAMLCPDCAEEYVDDATLAALDRVRGDGSDALPMVDQAFVPVLDYGSRG